MHRTNEKLWEEVKAEITKSDKGGMPNSWSARKAQLAVQEYKRRGGGYVGKKEKDNSLVQWTKQEWTTKSGKPSLETGERYLPKKAIEKLTPAQYAATTKAKRKGMKEGKQYVKQPKKIAETVKEYRDYIY
jgi:hypothetical protein